MTARKQTDPPVIVSVFVGRNPELDRILSLLLGSARLITLTGMGGIGKTQLAAEIGRRYHKARSVPVYWVRLARLSKGSRRTAVEDEIARSVTNADHPARSTWDTIVDALRHEDGLGRPLQTVLVLDNCEHVLDSVGALATELATAVPGLTILATSREVIGWDDEYIVEVPPLSAEDALTLFIQRAEAVGCPVGDADQNATAAAICRHMHNNPLFIRLAAARLRRQPLAGILRELNSADRVKLMSWSHGARTAEDGRHRDIGNAIAWSYNLCAEKERLLFERMSIFAAGYALDSGSAASDVGVDLGTIEAVCSDDSYPAGTADQLRSEAPTQLRRSDIAGLLDRLVDRSLVSIHIEQKAVRYSLLECLQVFARQRLGERSTGTVDEPTRLAKRHLRYFHDQVAHAAVNWVGPQEQDLLDWVRAAWPNVLTAIQNILVIPGESTLGLQTCIALHALPIPFVMGSLGEIRSWTERVLATNRSLTHAPAQLQLTASALLAGDAVRQGAPDDAERLLEECFSACHLGFHDRQTAADVDVGLPAAVEFAWGLELWFIRQDVRAVAVLTRAHTKYRQNNEPGFAAQTEVTAAGAAASLLDSPQQVDELIQRLLGRATTTGSPWLRAWADVAAALASIQRGDGPKASSLLQNALAYGLPLGDQLGTVALLHTWALARRITAAPDGTDRSDLIAWATRIAYMVGALSALRDRLSIGMQVLSDFAEKTDQAVAVATDVLGSSAFSAAFERGARINPEFSEIRQLAQGVFDTAEKSQTTPRRSDETSPWTNLSKAERQVAILAAAGLSNTLVAARRGTSVRTVDAQLAAILQKLMISSRHDIMDFIPEDRIAEVREEAARWIHSNRKQTPGRPPS